MQAYIHYRKLSGPLSSNLENASHVYIVESREGEKTVYGICDLYKQELELQAGKEIYILHFQQRKFYYNPASQTFTRLKPKLENVPFNSILNHALTKT